MTIANKAVLVTGANRGSLALAITTCKRIMLRSSAALSISGSST